MPLPLVLASGLFDEFVDLRDGGPVGARKTGSDGLTDARTTITKNSRRTSMKVI